MKPGQNLSDHNRTQHKILKTLQTLSASQQYHLWIYQNLKEHLSGTVMDLGSGTGDIAQHYIESPVDQVILTDHGEGMIKYLKVKFDHQSKYKVLWMDILRPNQSIPEDSLDTMTCINVLEHIDDDLNALLRMKKLLRPGGKLILMVPALPTLYGSLDALVGHYRRYTKISLSQKLRQAKFIIRDQYYMNFFGILTWLIAGRILKHKKFSAKAC